MKNQKKTETENKLIKKTQALRTRIAELESAEEEWKQLKTQLRENEERLNLVLDQLPSVIWTTDAELRFTSSLGTGLKKIGLNSGKLTGITLYEFFQTEDPDSTPIAMHRRALKGESVNFEQKWGGDIFQVYVKPFHNKEGQIIGTVGASLNITEHKEAEEFIRRERNLFMAGPVIVFKWAAKENWPVEYVSQNVSQFGYSAEDFISGKIQYASIVHQDDLERVAAEVQKHSQSGVEGFEQDYRIIKANGEVSCLYDLTTIVRDSQGKITHYYGYILDITDRKRAEEALRASEANYRAIFSAANDAIFIHDIETGDILDVNRKMCEMYGYTHDEVRRINVETLSAGLPPYTQKDALRWIRKAVEGEPQLFEWMAKDKAGRLFWVEVNLKRAVIGGKDRLLAIVRDIAERKRVEEERKKFEEQIRHAQKLESLGVLAGGIAHDFNNLLMGILGNAGIALRELSQESSVRRFIVNIQESSQRASSLCRQMLAYSGKGMFVIQAIDLNEVIVEMRDLMEASVSSGALLKHNLADKLPAIEGDPAQIHQVIINLITNASEAIGEKAGLITLTTGAMKCTTDVLKDTYMAEDLQEGEYVYIEVSDTGCGMDKETLSKMFDPFFTTKFIGRGLGLAAVLGIVRSHNGAVKVHSKLGKGTEFRVLFPSTAGKENRRNF